MKASIKKYNNSLQSQKGFASLLLPRVADLTESRVTYKDAAYKAGSLSDNSTSVGLRFLAELQRGLALFVYVLQLTFFRKCQESEKLAKMYKVHPMLRLTPVTALNPFYSFLTRKSSIVSNLFQRVRSAISLRCSVSFSVCS